MSEPAPNTGERTHRKYVLNIVAGVLALLVIVAVAAAVLRERLASPPGVQNTTAASLPALGQDERAPPVESTTVTAARAAEAQEKVAADNDAPALPPTLPANVIEPPLPEGDLLAELKQDFQPGKNGHPDHAGSGQWWYLASMLANPWFSRHELYPMAWDSSTKIPAHYEHGEPNADGEFRWPCAVPEYDNAVTVTPANTRPLHAVVRWISGVGGNVIIQGRFAKAMTNGGDGVEVFVFVDGMLRFREQLVGNDGIGKPFQVQAAVSPQSTVDFVVGIDGPGPDDTNEWDTTRILAKIVRTSSEMTAFEPSAEATGHLRQLVAEAPRIPLPADADVSGSFGRTTNRIAWARQTFLESYRRISGGNAQFDRAAEPFLEALCLWWAQDGSRPTNEEMIALGKRVIDAGCKDPLVRNGLMSLLSRGEGTEPTEAYEMLSALEPDIESSLYSPFVKAEFHAYAVTLNARHPKPRIVETETKRHSLKCLSALVDILAVKDLTDRDRQMLIMRLPYLYMARYLNVHRHYLMNALHDREDLDPWLRHMILAQGHYDLAWNARGSEEKPDLVSEVREARFRHHLQLARRHAIEAWHVRPQLPEAPAELVQITMSIGGAAGEAPRFWFDQTVKADFAHQEVYPRLRKALRAQANGRDELLSFGLECFQTGRFDTFVPSEFATALAEMVNDGADLATCFRRPEVQQTYRQWLERSGAGSNRSRLLALAWLAGEQDEVKRLMAELGPDIDPNAMSNLGVSPSKIRRSLMRTSSEVTDPDKSPLFDRNLGGDVRKLLCTDSGDLVVVAPSNVSFWPMSDRGRAPRSTVTLSRSTVAATAIPGTSIVAVQQFDRQQDRSIIVLVGGEGPQPDPIELAGTTITAMAASIDGKLLAVGRANGRIDVCEIATGKLVPWTLDKPVQQAVTCLCFTGTGTLAAGSSDGRVRLWDIPARPLETTGAILSRVSVSADGQTCRSIELTMDGTLLAVGTQWIRICDGATGKLRYSLPGRLAAFSPDGNWLLIAAADEMPLEAALFHSATGEIKGRLMGGHAQRIGAIAFSRDSKLVFTGDAEGIVRAWKVETGEELDELPAVE